MILSTLLCLAGNGCANIVGLGPDQVDDCVGFDAEEQESFIDRITSSYLDHMALFSLDPTGTVAPNDVEFEGSSYGNAFWTST
jgi:hypothetical protein